VLYIASCYGLTEVRNAVCKHISKNLHQIRQVSSGMWNSFKNLPARDLCSVLDDDDCSLMEKEVFDAALEWLKHEVGRITSCSSEVLAVVRFPLMSIYDLDTCSNELSSSDVPQDCYHPLLEEARAFHIKTDTDAVVSSRRTQMRNSVDVVIAVGGFTTSEHTTNRLQVLPVTELLTHSTNEIRSGFYSCFYPLLYRQQNK